MGKFSITLSGKSGSHRSTRTLGRSFEEASVTGVLNLSGKNLNCFPTAPLEYDIDDIVFADLSKNKFTQLPTEICDFFLLAELNCYHNVIRCFPDSVVALQSLTFLNLRNQLCIIPPALCQLPLQVLIINNNRLFTLPTEIGIMNQLMDLDVSCNKITYLPPQIGELESLRSLNLRRNFLTELPPELCGLQLARLDISSNEITFLPIHLYCMRSLQHLVVDNNPLISPLSILCEQGKAHIFKYLEMQANCKSKKHRVSLELDYHQSSEKANIFGTTRNNMSTHPIKWMGVSSSTSSFQKPFTMDYKYSLICEENMNNNNVMLNSQKEIFQAHQFKLKTNGTNLHLGSKKISPLLYHHDFIIKTRSSKAGEDKESTNKLEKKELIKEKERVLQEEVTKVVHTVQVLSSLCANKPEPVKPCSEFYISWLLLGLLIGTYLLIIVYPPPS
ncbi:leucine-rich repeat and calponin homology domain-containing protein 1-like isoform X2 [Tachypleus tridentatus]|uniref:leucine-rich repeat and calponin homology domain-containing protein 1-like isoform X2 n=1 Tax=Tachypleus tridentatus TaxID=6853 RepID=UPI003FD15D85